MYAAAHAKPPLKSTKRRVHFPGYFGIISNCITSQQADTKSPQKAQVGRSSSDALAAAGPPLTLSLP